MAFKIPVLIQISLPIFPSPNQRGHDQPRLRSHGQRIPQQHRQSWLLDHNLHGPSTSRSCPILVGTFVKQMRPATCAFGNDVLAFVSILGSAYAKTFNQLVTARVFHGLFPAAFALGPAVVVDIFLVHQRGRAIGLFTEGVLLQSEYLKRLDILRSLL